MTRQRCSGEHYPTQKSQILAVRNPEFWCSIRITRAKRLPTGAGRGDIRALLRISEAAKQKFCDARAMPLTRGEQCATFLHCYNFAARRRRRVEGAIFSCRGAQISMSSGMCTRILHCREATGRFGGGPTGSICWSLGKRRPWIPGPPTSDRGGSSNTRA